MFTLKVVFSLKSQCIFPDEDPNMKSEEAIQRHSFCHLIKYGFCAISHAKLLYKLAELHGWKVEERTVLDITK